MQAGRTACAKALSQNTDGLVLEANGASGQTHWGLMRVGERFPVSHTHENSLAGTFFFFPFPIISRFKKEPLSRESKPLLGKKKGESHPPWGRTLNPPNVCSGTPSYHWGQSVN